MFITCNLNLIKKNRWFFYSLQIKRFTHTKSALETLSKEVITYSRVHTFSHETQSLFLIDGHVSSRLDPELSHIIRTWKTALPYNETESIYINRRIFSLISNSYSLLKPKIRGGIFPYNSTKFSEEVLQAFRLNKYLLDTNSSITINQDQQLDNSMFSISPRNSNPDFLLADTIGMDLKTSYRIPPGLRNGELIESYKLRSHLFLESELDSIYDKHIQDLRLLNKKEKELNILYDKIFNIVNSDSNIDMNEKMKEIAKECLLFDATLSIKEKLIGVGILLPSLTLEQEIKQFSSEIDNSGKLTKLYTQSEEIFEKLSFEDKQKILFLVDKSIQTNSMSLKDYNEILNILKHYII